MIKKHLNQGVMIDFDGYLATVASMNIKSNMIDEIKALIKQVTENSNKANAPTSKIACRELKLTKRDAKEIVAFKLKNYPALLSEAGELPMPAYLLSKKSMFTPSRRHRLDRQPIQSGGHDNKVRRKNVG